MTFAEWLQAAQWNGHNGESQMHPQDQLCDECCHTANTIEDIDKLCAVSDVTMSRVMSPFENYFGLCFISCHLGIFDFFTVVV